MQTSNPILQIKNSRRGQYVSVGQEMTIQGVVNKTGLLLICLFLSASWTWMQFFSSGFNPAAIQGLMMGGLFGGLILGFTTIFKKEWASVTAPLYALAEGLFIGGISSIFEVRYPGIVIHTATLTFGTLAAMLLAYQSGMIRPTEKFKLGVIAATGGIALVYFFGIILSFFGINFSLLFGSGIVGIGFSLFVVAIAALNLILDFSLIEEGARSGQAKHMEWYYSFALMVTLVWLYIEFLRLLSKLRNR